MLRWTEISNQTTLRWPTLRGCFCTLVWVIIHFHSESLFSLFCSVCLKLRRKSRISPATSITSLIKSSGSVSLEAIHVHVMTLPPSRLTDDVTCFRSWVFSLLHYTVIFLSYHLILSRYPWVHPSKDFFLFQNCADSFGKIWLEN